ncbi:hypothetical protein GCM10010341_39290 [Streptomyces noursei]|nr:hypothetical protein GCM10010341_39290 [Streptomyces noursei]
MFVVGEAVTVDPLAEADQPAGDPGYLGEPDVTGQGLGVLHERLLGALRSGFPRVIPGVGASAPLWWGPLARRPRRSVEGSDTGD